MPENKRRILVAQHRDTLFRGYFKIIKNFLHLLRHCRGGGDILTDEDIEPFDLESTVAYRMRRNDISFITKDNRLIILIEHQTSINPNMALRLFFYYTELMQLWIKMNNINLYSKTKINELPVPEFYVVYNGTDPLKEKVSTFHMEHNNMKVT